MQIEWLDQLLTKAHNAITIGCAVIGLAILLKQRPDLLDDIIQLHHAHIMWSYEDAIIATMGPLFLVMFGVCFGWLGCFCNMLIREFLQVVRYW